jgi:hypothetical protein
LHGQHRILLVLVEHPHWLGCGGGEPLTDLHGVSGIRHAEHLIRTDQVNDEIVHHATVLGAAQGIEGLP